MPKKGTRGDTRTVLSQRPMSEEQLALVRQACQRLGPAVKEFAEDVRRAQNDPALDVAVVLRVTAGGVEFVLAEARPTAGPVILPMPRVS